ncbi:CD63 antigen [Fragariocoptes setiger]|uniref:Tetraspanin n=1 Tax=Fragariocoptes setiger TaxID=1670756 RepID=A0ABQ7SAP3_9ACAR|nr:CD63 antigen [Fragariocoptes setiger]
MGVCGIFGRVFVSLICLVLFGLSLGFVIYQSYVLVRFGSFLTSWIWIGALVVIAVLMVTTFCGCIAAAVNSRGMLVVFAVFMILITAVTCFVCVKYLLPLHSEGAIEREMEDLYKDWNNNGTEKRKFIDDLQKDLACCGSTKYPAPFNENNLPASCCVPKDASTIDQKCDKNVDKVHKVSCSERLREIEPYSYYMAFALMGAQMIAIVGAVIGACDQSARS